MKLSEYDKINDNDEKYAFFHEFTYNLDFSNVTLDEIWNLIDISFTLFRYCFENNEFENSEYVSKQCEKMLDYYLCASNWEELCVNDEKIEFILDVVCFVYELSYKYEQKSKILRKVLEDKFVNKNLRYRALEEARLMVTYSNLFTESDISNFANGCG